jgi:hypothetical protein
MNCEIYLRNGTVYVPTMGKMDKGFFRGVEPVAVASVSNTGALQQALQAAIARGNPDVPMLKRGEWPPPVTLKYAGVKSWSAFERGMQLWSLEQKNGVFQIAPHEKSPNRMWVPIKDEIIAFPAAASVDDVVDRMIAILQDAARI